jgi:hypothetical protein
METSNPSGVTMPHLQARQSVMRGCAPGLQTMVLMTIKTQLGEINSRNQPDYTQNPPSKSYKVLGIEGNPCFLAMLHRVPHWGVFFEQIE